MTDESEDETLDARQIYGMECYDPYPVERKVNRGMLFTLAGCCGFWCGVIVAIWKWW